MELMCKKVTTDAYFGFSPDHQQSLEAFMFQEFANFSGNDTKQGHHIMGEYLEALSKELGAQIKGGKAKQKTFAIEASQISNNDPKPHPYA